MMRDKQHSGDDRSNHTSARNSEDEARSSRGGRVSYLGRESYTFERRPSNEPLSCTGIRAARDHVDAPTEGDLRHGKSKTNDFMEFCQRVFALRAGFSVPLNVHHVLVA